MYFISQYSKLTELGLRLAPATRWILTSTLLILISALWYVGPYTLLNARARAECARLKTLNTQQSVLASLQQTHDQLLLAVSAQKADWNVHAQQAATKGAHEQLFALLELFAQHGITVQSYYPHAPVSKGWYTAMSAQVHVTCTFTTLLSLLEALRASNMHFECRDMRIERRDAQLYVVMTVQYKIPQEISDAKN